MKRIFIILVLTFSFSRLLISKNVLIIYDGEKEKSEAFKSSMFIYYLLDHFSINSKETFNVRDYRRDKLNNKDFVFVVFEEGFPEFEDNFISDLLNFKGEIVWINMHIERLLKRGEFHIEFEDFKYGKNWKVFYKNEDFPKEEPGMNLLKINDKKEVKIISTAVDENGKSFPYVIRTKNLWYFADSPFSFAMEGGRFLILADLLHDILKEEHRETHLALLRIEDLNPEDDPSNLKRIAKYLSKEGIPFQISLIPFFKDPENQYESSLSENSPLVSAIKFSMERGGTVILHGETHQLRGLTGEDYEFWDDISGKPISNESPYWVDEKLKRAIEECVKNGIYPLSWETPHYSASKNVYRTISKYFSAFNERIMSAEISGTQQIFPYPAYLKDLGVLVIPENLGYVNYLKPEPEKIIENAKNMMVVRDGIASFFFHSFVPIKHLKRIVGEMRKMGWEFISIRDFPCDLKTESLWVTSKGGEGKINLKNQYIHELLIDRNGKIISEKFSSNRHNGIFTKNLPPLKGGLYILEGIDTLPERKKGLKDIISERFFQKKGKREILNVPEILFVKKDGAKGGERFDQDSFESVFRVFGFKPKFINKEKIIGTKLRNFKIVCIPFPSAKEIKKEELNSLMDFVESGGIIITDGKTPLSEGLGIRFENEKKEIREVKELSLPVPNLYWNPPVFVDVFRADESIVLSKDVWSEQPLAIIKPLKKGKILYFATLFDPLTPFGISRFPYFPFYLRNSLQIPFIAKRNRLEFYFDPGLRQNVSLEKLVRRWKASGVKIVYLATWHFYRNWRFDYKYFIDLCHNFGISVYAWFEFPQVSPLFWDENPNWREKTPTGADALCHWRLLMNLYNSSCREAVKEFLWKMLMDYDWDGVNLAELNFDTNKGGEDPSKFTPMNDDVRRDFKKIAGFDPIELFNPKSPFYFKRNPSAYEKFLIFRKDILKELHFFFLTEIEKIKRAKGKDMEVIVTAMDSIVHPEIFEECGIDTRDIISLMENFSFTLQIEDPSRSWISLPSRYLDYLNVYRNFVKEKERLMFDVNCIGRRDISGTNLPSPLSIGTELATTLYFAAMGNGRVGIYSESTVLPTDMDILPFVFGRDVEIYKVKEGYLFKAREPFTLSLNLTEHTPYLDGQKWHFYGGRGIYIPSGSHILSFKKEHSIELTLSHKIEFDGEISDFKREGEKFILFYNSKLPVSLTFNRPLEEVKLDGKELSIPLDKNGVVLPKGDHKLEIVPSTSLSYTLDVVGYVSSSLFYLIGFISVSSLFLIYIYSKIRK